MDKLKKILFSTPLLKVLDFFLQNPECSYYDQEVASLLKTAKKSSVNYASRKLGTMGLLHRKQRGRAYYNSLAEDRPFMKYFKILSNLLEIDGLISKIQNKTSKVILFGSRATGGHRSDSDWDLLIVCQKPNEILSVIEKNRGMMKIQAVLKRPADWLKMPSLEKEFYQLIKTGIVLWERV